MPRSVPALSWIPYQGGAQGTLVATVNLDSAVDTEFFVPANGMYNNNITYADVVIIFNQNNNGVVTIASGPIAIGIDAYSRDYLQLPGSSVNLLDVKFTVGTIQLQFYKGQPPVNPSVYNYAGAQALSNNVVFNGGLTVGLNTMSIDVATNYLANNGVIVIGTISQANTGSVTLNVNGKGPIPIMRLVPGILGLGPSELLLQGGELGALCNFAVTFNASTGNFNLLLPQIDNDNVVTSDLAANTPVLTANVFTTLIQLPILFGGVWDVDVCVTYDNTHAATSMRAESRIINGAGTTLGRVATTVPPGAGTGNLSFSKTVTVVAPDTITLQATDNVGGNWGVVFGTPYTAMSIRRVS